MVLLLLLLLLLHLVTSYELSCFVVLCGALLGPGNEATLNFYLTNFTSQISLLTEITNIQYLGGDTNTTGGLRLMRTEVFNSANGDRSDVRNVAVLITDGIPNLEVELLPGEVATIRSLGIRTIGVGVSNKVSSWQSTSMSVSAVDKLTR